MPAPPPPPPPMGGPSPKGSKAPKMGGGAPDDRGALLSSIRQGAKLKKTVTVDKSGPYIPGKEGSAPSSAPSGGSNGTGSARASPATMNGGPPGLGGLFAGGMPKLRATGMGIGGSPRAESSAPKTTGNVVPKLPVNSTPKFPVNSAPTPSNVPRKSTQSPEKSKGPSILQQPKSKSPSPQMEQTRVPSGPSVSQLSQVLGNTLMRGNEPPVRPPEPRSTRGPPPQPPAPNRLNLTTTSETTISTVIMNRVQNLTSVETTSQTILAAPPSPNISSLHPNKSSLHGASTNWNSSNPLPSPTLTRTSSPNDVTDSSSITSRVINHGKPNVAPKPPGIVVSPNGQINNGKPQVQSPKKQPGLNGRHASRSQSVRVPRSPPVTPPCPPSSTEFSNNGFSPLKINAFHQSQDSIDRKPLMGLSKNAAPQPPLSGSRTLGRAPVRPPAHCPPPPPSRPLNQPPPPPPHRQPAILPQHIRSNSSPNAGPPQPPIRNSSMRTSELDSRFADKFKTMERFPFPDPFLKIEKTYSSVNSAINNNIVNKQQAPMPPKTHIQLTPKPWANNTSNC